MEKEVVVTGMGTINAIGDNVKAFSDSLRKGKVGFQKMFHDESQIAKVDVYAPIKWEGVSSFQACANRLTKSKELCEKARKLGRRADYPMQWAIVAALEAWEEARIDESVDLDRVGVIVSGSNLGQNLQYSLIKDFMESPEYISPRYALSFMDTDYVGTLSEIFGIHGGGFSIGGASASGNMAVIKAMQQIELGVIDACMVVGGPTLLSPMELQGFVNIGAMDGNIYEDVNKSYCPFDERHSGFIYGQAAGCLILESKEHAKKREAKIYASLLGGKVVLDGNRLADPNVIGEVKAIKGALNDAKLDPKRIDYINTHGTASKLGDQTELDAIRQVFKEHANEIYINSTKGYTGHCLFSAGIVEMIATIIQMNQGFIHANKSLETPIDLQLKLLKENKDDVEIHYAISNAFGFGGINTCVVVGKG